MRFPWNQIQIQQKNSMTKWSSAWNAKIVCRLNLTSAHCWIRTERPNCACRQFKCITCIMSTSVFALEPMTSAHYFRARIVASSLGGRSQGTRNQSKRIFTVTRSTPERQRNTSNYGTLDLSTLYCHEQECTKAANEINSVFSQLSPAIIANGKNVLVMSSSGNVEWLGHIHTLWRIIFHLEDGNWGGNWCLEIHQPKK